MTGATVGGCLPARVQGTRALHSPTAWPSLATIPGVIGTSACRCVSRHPRLPLFALGQLAVLGADGAVSSSTRPPHRPAPLPPRLPHLWRPCPLSTSTARRAWSAPSSSCAPTPHLLPPCVPTRCPRLAAPPPPPPAMTPSPPAGQACRRWLGGLPMRTRHCCCSRPARSGWPTRTQRPRDCWPPAPSAGGCWSWATRTGRCGQRWTRSEYYRPQHRRQQAAGKEEDVGGGEGRGSPPPRLREEG